ncbi:MAG: hypothetical protein U0W40_14885 [Acidimicrobiia bacterium]
MVAGSGTDALTAAVEHSADAATARIVVDRLVEARPTMRSLLGTDATVREGVLALAGASRSLTSAFVADPSLLDCLLDRDHLAREQSEAELRASWSAHARAHGADEHELRRWKRATLLRVAARDLLGLADMPAVGRELAALAAVCLEAAVAIVDPPEPFAVIAMGKLGGRELNYASDVDVLFVHDGDPELAAQSARRLLTVMSQPGEQGIVFRTDADLRPEGAAGPLSRTLDSYLHWYETWARPWEFQALIKARPVAGDPDLGRRFVEATRRFVWPERLDADTVREIRAMKERAEAQLAARGLADRELKRGRGGIRDIEFAVQLLQLVHGRHDDAVRSPTTLDALGALAAGGYVTHTDAQRLDHAYQFLRTVEHRLQLQDEQQTHTVPDDDAARTRLARVLGYRDEPWRGALEGFDADAREQQRAVRSIHERLFFAPLLDALAGIGPLPADAAADRLSAFGFTDMERTRAAVRELATGLNRRSRLMQELLPLVLGWLSEAPDPDLGLLQLRRLAEGPARSASLATTLRDAPGAAERACLLLGSSRVVGDALRRHPEFVDQLDDVSTMTEKSRADLVDEVHDTLEWRGDEEQRRRPSSFQAARAAAHRHARHPRPRVARGHRARAQRAGRGVPRRRARVAAAHRALRRDRARTPRWWRAVVRVRHRRDVRVRRRRCHRLRAGRAARDAARAGDRCDHRRRSDLPHRRPASSRRGRRSARPQCGQLRGLLRAVGTYVGAPGTHAGARRRRRRGARRPLPRPRRRRRLRAALHRRRHPRDPPGQGTRGTRTHPTG